MPQRGIGFIISIKEPIPIPHKCPPIYRQLAALGHVGRTDIELPWERLDRVEELKAAM